MGRFSAYMLKCGEQQLLMEDVARIERDGEAFWLSSLSGRRQRVEAEITLVDLGRSTLLFAQGESAAQEEVRILLESWVQYHTDHCRQLRKTADRAAALGKGAAHRNIADAAAKLDGVVEHLTKALDALRTGAT